MDHSILFSLLNLRTNHFKIYFNFKECWIGYIPPYIWKGVVSTNQLNNENVKFQFKLLVYFTLTCPHFRNWVSNKSKVLPKMWFRSELSYDNWLTEKSLELHLTKNLVFKPVFETLDKIMITQVEACRDSSIFNLLVKLQR